VYQLLRGSHEGILLIATGVFIVRITTFIYCADQLSLPTRLFDLAAFERTAEFDGISIYGGHADRSGKIVEEFLLGRTFFQLDETLVGEICVGGEGLLSRFMPFMILEVSVRNQYTES
jgi:hypothetical protein